MRAPDGTFTTFRYGPHTWTFPQAINNAGTVVGYALDFSSGYAFLRTRRGAFTPILPSFNAEAMAINKDGVITGQYSDGAIRGFVRDTSGNITAFDAPGSLETHPLSINDAGGIAGYYYDDNLVYRGFLRAPDGTITNFDAPGAGMTDQGQGTMPRKIDANGNIVGCMWDSSFVMHGFVRDATGNMHVIDAPGAPGTCVTTIGPTGKLVGQAGPHGFRVYRRIWRQAQ